MATTCHVAMVQSANPIAICIDHTVAQHDHIDKQPHVGTGCMDIIDVPMWGCIQYTKNGHYNHLRIRYSGVYRQHVQHRMPYSWPTYKTPQIDLCPARGSWILLGTLLFEHPRVAPMVVSWMGRSRGFVGQKTEQMGKCDWCGNCSSCAVELRSSERLVLK